MKGTPQRGGLGRWVWLLGLVAVTVILVKVGRYLIAGAFTVIGAAFVLCLVLAIVGLFLAMALPGPAGTLHGLPRSPSGARRAGQAAWASIQLRLGQTPWRSPKRVIGVVADLLDRKVLELPTGPAAYSHLRVRLHPETLHRLDAWMPVEAVAAEWADHYAQTHRDTRGHDDRVTVTVSASTDVPIGRVLVEGGFRADATGPDDWARAQRFRTDRSGQVPGDAVRLRAPQVVDLTVMQTPGLERDRRLHPDATTGREAEATAGVDPHMKSGLDREATTRPDPDATTRLDPEATTRLAAGATGLDPGATTRIAAVVDPPPAGEPTVAVSTTVATGQPTPCTLGLRPMQVNIPGRPASAPSFFDAQRVLVGRGSGMDLRIDDPHVSQQHAEIRRIDGWWTIADSGSINGTAVNGIPLAVGARQLLQDGDLIAFGSTRSTATPTYRVLVAAAPRADRTR